MFCVAALRTRAKPLRRMAAIPAMWEGQAVIRGPQSLESHGAREQPHAPFYLLDFIPNPENSKLPASRPGVFRRHARAGALVLRDGCDGRPRSHPSPPPFLALRREGGRGRPPLQGEEVNARCGNHITPTPRVFVHNAQNLPLKNAPKTPVRMCESDEIASCVSALK